MSETVYQIEWKRQAARTDIPSGHLGVHRWYLRFETPQDVVAPKPPRDDLTVARASNPTIDFYRFLYHTAGEEYLWGDRRRLSDAELSGLISPESIHVMVLYAGGVPCGYFELDFSRDDLTNLKYFALLPGFKGEGLGNYMLSLCIHMAGSIQAVPLTVDTCTLDHPIALENYKARGFEPWYSEDEIYADPRLDGTVPPDAGKHVPKAL